jgi:hypothetical protein
MITRDQAERIAAELTGIPPDTPRSGWELREFSAGWLLVEHAGEGRRGSARRVIERETGRVLRFPSFIPPGRISGEYEAVAVHARPDEHQPAAGAELPLCARCGREVRVNRDTFDLLERMHYVCFHYEFERTGFDPDEECDAGDCPASSLTGHHHRATEPDTGPAQPQAAPVSGRQVSLLGIVAEGRGHCARRIDQAVSVRLGPGEGTVLQELQALAQLGLVTRDDSRSGPGGRWAVTAAARPYLR